MAVQYSATLLEENVAPGITTFVSATIPDLRADFPEGTHWLSNHFLNNIFGGRFKPPHKQYAVNFILRTQTAFHYYHKARDTTLKYLDGNSPLNPRIRVYYEAITEWEFTLLTWLVCLDLVNQMNDSKAFAPGEGSTEERAHRLATDLKHFGSRIREQNVPASDSIPIWMTNEGLCSRSALLSYAELADLLRDIAKLANEVQNPREFVQSNQPLHPDALTRAGERER